MTETNNPTRRELLMSSLLLPFAAGSVAAGHAAGAASERRERARGVLHAQRQHSHYRRPAQPRSPGRTVRNRAGDALSGRLLRNGGTGDAGARAEYLPPLKATVSNLPPTTRCSSAFRSGALRRRRSSALSWPARTSPEKRSCPSICTAATGWAIAAKSSRRPHRRRVSPKASSWRDCRSAVQLSGSASGLRTQP